MLAAAPDRAEVKIIDPLEVRPSLLYPATEMPRKLGTSQSNTVEKGRSMSFQCCMS